MASFSGARFELFYILCLIAVTQYKPGSAGCPPGTLPVSDGQEAHNSTLLRCQCGNVPTAIDQMTAGADSDSIINLYNGIAFCDQTENGLRAYVRKSFWAGYYAKHANDTDNNSCHPAPDLLVVSQCPESFCHFNRSEINAGVEIFPGFDSDELFCAPRHREGFLCSRCTEGYGVAINGINRDCADCKSGPSGAVSVFIWILVELLPEAVLVYVYVIVDAPLLKGHMNSFLLFAHTFRAMNLYANGILDFAYNSDAAKSLTDWINWIYSLWSLNFLASAPFFPNLCVSNNNTEFSSLTKHSVQYVVAFLPFPLLFIVYILRWCYRREPLKLDFVFRAMQKVHNCIARIQHYLGKTSSSVRNGFASFLLLVYSKVCFVSFYLLASETLSTNCTVVFLDPHLRPFDPIHRPHAVFACFAIALFILCPILILLFYKPLAWGYEKLKVTNNATMQQRFQCVPCKKHIYRIFNFLDVFSEGFQEKYAFFGGLLFLYRAVMWAMFANIATPADQYVGQICVTFLLLVVHLACMPYKRKLRWLNRFDALMYCNIILITAMSMYNYYLLASNRNPLKSIYAIQQVFVILPMFYPIIVFVGYLVYLRRRKRLSRSTLSQENISYGAISSLSSLSVAPRKNDRDTELQNNSVSPSRFERDELPELLDSDLEHNPQGCCSFVRHSFVSKKRSNESCESCRNDGNAELEEEDLLREESVLEVEVFAYSTSVQYSSNSKGEH